jgi:hypothetical protein
MPFRNTLFRLHRQVGTKCDSGWEICGVGTCSRTTNFSTAVTLRTHSPMKTEQTSVPKCWHLNTIRRRTTQNKTYDNKFYVQLTVHLELYLYNEPTQCTVFSHFITLVCLYMFQAHLWPIIRRLGVYEGINKIFWTDAVKNHKPHH